MNNGITSSTASFVGEGLGCCVVFWLRLELGLLFGIGVGPFSLEDDAWSEVVVTKAAESEGGALVA